MPTANPPTVLRPDAGIVRSARAALAALMCTVLAGGAHHVAGGRASSLSLALVVASTWAVAMALSGRRLTTSQLLGLLLIGQAGTHVLSPPATSGSDVAMLVAHVAGTALSVLVLRRGEDALWTLTERVALRAASLAAPAARPVRRHHFVPAVRTAFLRPVQLAHVIEERGPPAGPP